MPADGRPVIVVVGPTASGKSTLSIALAQACDGEVVSADSMQVYRGMDIGTAKVPVEERIVPHHGLDLVDPGEPFSAALFQAYARAAFADIASRGRRAVLCGGTGFYVRAAIDDYDFPAGEQVGNPVRDSCAALLAEIGAPALWERLQKADPASAAVIAPNDSKRVIRAFELLEQGESYAVQKERLSRIPQAVPAVMIGLAVTPDVLRQRIDARVDEMFSSGLVDEVNGLLRSGFREGVTAPQAIGYKEVVDAIDGRCALDEAIERIKCATRRYAKRQRTWFRKDARIHWLNADDGDLERLVFEAMDIIGETR